MTGPLPYALDAHTGGGVTPIGIAEFAVRPDLNGVHRAGRQTVDRSGGPGVRDRQRQP